MVKITILIFLALLTAFSVNAENANESDLPVLAKEATALGLAAARQEEWTLAIDHFDKARKISPASPEILFNLALANDRAGGRELPAILWYRVYLAALPDAENTKQVNDRIIELEIIVEANARKFLNKAQVAILEMDESKNMGVYDNIVEAQILMDDIDGALDTADEIPEKSGVKQLAYSLIVQEYFKRGDTEAIEQILDKVAKMKNGDSIKSFLTCKISNLQAETGDIKGAKETLNRIDKANERSTYESAYVEIIKQQAAFGDIKGAKKAAEDVIADKDRKLELYCHIADAEIDQGRIKDSLSTIEEIKKSASGYELQHKIVKCARYGDIGILQVKAGEIKAAEKTLDLLKDEYNGEYYMENENETWGYLASMNRGHIEGYISKIEDSIKKAKEGLQTEEGPKDRIAELSSISEETAFKEISDLSQAIDKIKKAHPAFTPLYLASKSRNMMLYLRKMRGEFQGWVVPIRTY